MERQPKISVIIPVYNVERYLRECLDSVIHQTLKDIEIICVDDGSTDNSLEILHEYAAIDQRIHILTQENANAGAARNNGLSIATGKYLSFLDSDDFFDLTMLECAYNQAEKVDAEIVVFRMQHYLEEKQEFLECKWSVKQERLPEKEVFSSREINNDFFKSILGYTWDKLFRTDFIRENEIKFQSQPVFNDSYFTYCALLCADKISFIDKVLVYQRKRAAHSSITDRRSMYVNCAYTLLYDLKLFLQLHKIYDRYEQSFLNYAVHLLYLDLSSKEELRRKEFISLLKHEWLAELDLWGQSEEIIYEHDKYISLLNEAMGIENGVQEEQSVIPIVYATDANYFRYVLVSMLSALQHQSVYHFYHFVILVPQDFNQENISLTNDLIQRYERASVDFMYIHNEFDNAHLSIAHITTPTYYRLLLPSILPQYDKCIYLDGDTIINSDLANLFYINMEDNYLAGVRAYIYYRDEKRHRERLGYEKVQSFDYVNAGVLLMNLKQMRLDNKVPEFMDLVNMKYESQDQDILNVSCRGRIRLLPLKFNFMTKYANWKVKDFQELAKAHEVSFARKKPAIIHYADKIKPWSNVRSAYAREWLPVALDESIWGLFSEEMTPIIISALYGKGYTSRESRNYKKELSDIQNSKSYKIGRIITFIPRKIRGGIQCIKDHGACYTMKYTVRKIIFLIQK